MSFQEFICKTMLRFRGAVAFCPLLCVIQGKGSNHAGVPCSTACEAGGIHNDCCQKITEKPTALSICSNLCNPSNLLLKSNLSNLQSDNNY